MPGKRFSKSSPRRKNAVGFNRSKGSSGSNRSDMPDRPITLEPLKRLERLEPRSLEPVKPLRIVVTDFAFRCLGNILPLDKLIDRFFHADDALVGKIGRPEQTLVAEQFQITAGGHLFAALEINLPALDQFCRRQRLAHAVAHLAHEIGHPTAAGFQERRFSNPATGRAIRKT